MISNECFNNTSFNSVLSDHVYTTGDLINLNNTFQFNIQPIVKINTNIFSCELENINFESICLPLSNCDGGEPCSKIKKISNLVINGKEPLYSFVASENGIYSKLVELQIGKYEIIPNNNDVISSNYCNEIKLDGVSFKEFTMGSSISQDNISILCINIGDGCYGRIKNGETQVCHIHKVVIKIYSKRKVGHNKLKNKEFKRYFWKQLLQLLIHYVYFHLVIGQPQSLVSLMLLCNLMYPFSLQLFAQHPQP